VTALGLNAPAPVSFSEKVWRINWGLVLVLTAIAAVGVVSLYSAAGGRFLEPAVQALAAQNADLDLDHVQPAGVLWRVVELKTLEHPAGLWAGKAS
jgi:hypothetical protein